MGPPMPGILPEIYAQLENLYEEVMWLRSRPNVTSSVARSWYTHACAERLKRHIRRFSGFVSDRALVESADLRLEHYKRIQTTLTQLVERHYISGSLDAEEFISTILSCEKVHVVTRFENYEAMKAKGDYEIAGIKLLHWDILDEQIRARIWKKMLRGKVSNHHEYQPNT